MIGLYIFASIAVICLTLWDVRRRDHIAETESDKRRMERDTAVRLADEQRISAQAAHQAAIAEYTADRARYENALKTHEQRIRSAEEYISHQRAPQSGRRLG